MRGVRITIFAGIILMLMYAVSMLFVEESKSFSIETTVNYPVQKVYPQFSNLQNFTQWNEFFVSKDNLTYSYYTPYEGQGSSLNYQDLKEVSQSGDLFLKYANPFSTLKYELFEGNQATPYKIDIKFIPEKNKTRIIWHTHTPRQPLLKRSLNLFTEDYLADNIEKSMQNLTQLLSGKVDKEILLSKIKYDTLTVETQKGMLLLGINVSTSNKKGNFIKSIELNHNKVVNFVKKDLGKKEDEFGSPILIMEANGYANKEASYFYGVTLPKRIAISDNNFSFRTVNPSQNYVIYYKGNYEDRTKAIKQLLKKASEEKMRYGSLQETFLETPQASQQIKLKLSLPVFR